MRVTRGKFLMMATIAVIFGVLFFSVAEEKRVSSVCFRDHCFKVELAVTPSQRTRGLMFRDSLAKDKGMLFVYNKEDCYPFWMKNTKIPLDIIWMDKERKVVFIKNNASPCGLTKCTPIYPNRKAKYVLEVNANIAKDLGIHTGDYARFCNTSN